MIHIKINDTGSELRLEAPLLKRVKETLFFILEKYDLAPDPEQTKDALYQLALQMRTLLLKNIETKTGRGIGIAFKPSGLLMVNSKNFDVENHRYGDMVTVLLHALSKESSQNWSHRQLFKTSFTEYVGLSDAHVEKDLKSHVASLTDTLFGDGLSISAVFNQKKIGTESLRRKAEEANVEIRQAISEAIRDSVLNNVISATIEVMVIPEPFSNDRELVRDQASYANRICQNMAEEASEEAKKKHWRFSSFTVETLLERSASY